MPGTDPSEARLRWATWALALVIAASIWGFGLWARMAGDATRVIAAFPYVVVVQAALGVVLVGLLITLRRQSASNDDQRPGTDDSR